MFLEHLGTAIGIDAIVIANILIGIPFIIFAWYLGWVWPIESSKNNFDRAKHLLSDSVLLNSMWIVLAFLPYEWSRKDFIQWAIYPPRVIGVMLIGFACLCISIYVTRGMRGPGRLALRIGQYVLLTLSSLGWLLVLMDTLYPT